jgi:hypothetical protein
MALAGLCVIAQTLNSYGRDAGAGATIDKMIGGGLEKEKRKRKKIQGLKIEV